ncbi:MAG: hypothetical protein J4N36_07570 [Chloroflexi bacterium]|nr:hypothetical protein [Chloroflexota bacterium]MCI0784417.1 hypothetical protein [Chloroflexota bacterium]MCI0815040.1 hypothetical protein [Chloroflexota bacterium]MCI0818384.1 hypothetical protein [Chloroflexota bacterium]MCI0819340.1 hypothetical protein [Chloroflexota bacterium]
MGRTLMYAAITALAALVLSATFLLKHGGESVASVQQVSVHDLTSAPNHFDGDSVTTVGVLGFSEEHDRYELIGNGNFAVIIREYAGRDSLDGLVGREVRVRGVFGIDQESGVYIDATHVGPVAD